MRYRLTFVARLILAVLISAFLCPCAADAAIQVYTSRTAWETAMGGHANVLTEDFNSITLPDLAYYNGSVPVYEKLLTAGVNKAGLLNIDIPQLSGNFLYSGAGNDTVNGTNYWGVEASTQNGANPPISPELLFDYSVKGFAADWDVADATRMTVTINGQAITFSPYVSNGIHFLGFVDTAGFTEADLSVNSPFNILFGVDNVSFPVPEPSTFVLAALGGLTLLALRKRSAV